MNKIHHITGILLVIVFLFIPKSFSGESLSNLPAAFLDVGLDAKGMGMAGAQTALVNDVSAVLWNPAALTNIPENQNNIMFSMTRQFDLIPYYMTSYGRSIGGLHGAAVTLITAGDDVLRENIMHLSYAYNILNRSSSLGISLKIYNASFGNNTDGRFVIENVDRQVKGSAFGAGFDFGGKHTFSDKVIVALIVKDIFSSINYDASNQAGTATGGSEFNPAQITGGIGFIADKNTSVELDFQKGLHHDTYDRIKTGVERAFWGKFLVFRAGYAQNLGGDFVNKVISLGVGTNVKVFRRNNSVSVDTAFLFTDIQNYFHVSFRMSF